MTQRAAVRPADAERARGIRVANAPCSWGTIEGFGGGGPWSTMLDELAAAGYAGTELGDLGYLPDDPDRLAAELAARDLVMLGGFEGLPLRRPGVVAAWRERLLRVARLLAAVGGVGDPGRQPYLILADEPRGDPRRDARASTSRGSPPGCSIPPPPPSTS